MSETRKAVVLGAVAGAVIVILYYATPRHFIIWGAFAALAIALTIWMYRARVPGFWNRARLALIAIAVASLPLVAVGIIADNQHVTPFGFFAGLSIMYALASLTSVVMAALSRRAAVS